MRALTSFSVTLLTATCSAGESSVYLLQCTIGVNYRLSVYVSKRNRRLFKNRKTFKITRGVFGIMLLVVFKTGGAVVARGELKSDCMWKHELHPREASFVQAMG